MPKNYKLTHRGIIFCVNMVLFLCFVSPAFAATITVNTLVDENDGVGTGDISLRDAINEANSNGEDDTINFSVTGTITLTSELPAITTNIVIEGPGDSLLTIDGNSTYQIFFIDNVAATLSNLTVANGLSQGGAGGTSSSNGSGGGGGAGMGGAVFIDSSAIVSIIDVTFDSNAATGGDGGNGGTNGFRGGGGGGGWASNGSTSSNSMGGTGGSGGALGGSGGGGGAAPPSGGSGGNGNDASGDGAGGGGGGAGTTCGDGGNGGDGAFGGGGAGGGGGCNSTGDGGNGGFGGGGGGGGRSTFVNAPLGNGGNGGMHGGNGVTPAIAFDKAGGGGGGAGLGGAIFVRTGAQLALINVDFISNAATGGSGGTGNNSSTAASGEGKGGAIYVHAGATVFESGTTYGTGGDANSASDDNASSGDDDDVYGTITTMPIVQSMTLQSVNPSNASQVTYFVTFSEAVTGVNAADFTVVASGVSGASINSTILDVGGGAIYAVTIDTGTGSGTVALKLVDDDSIENGSNVKLGGTGAGNGDFTASGAYTIDKGAPRAMTTGAITRNDANPTKASQVSFVVAFDETVTGVDTTDFSIDATGLTGSTLSNVTDQGGGNFLVTVNVGSGQGTLSIDLIDDDSIKDGVNNTLGGTGTGNGNVTDGEVYTVDKVKPSVASIAPSTNGPTNADSVSFTVTFDEAVSDFNDTDDVNVEHNGTAHTGVSIVKQTNTVYTVTISGITGDGELLLFVKANAASDSLGNKNTVSTASDAVAIDNTVPDVESISIPSELDEFGRLVVEIVFSENVTGFDANDIMVNHDGTAHDSISIESDSETTYRAIVTDVSGSGTISVTLNESAVTDSAGNGNAAATSSSLVISEGGDDSDETGGNLCGTSTMPMMGLMSLMLVAWRRRHRNVRDQG